MNRGVYHYNPYTGMPRHPKDIKSDPQGLLIVEPGVPLQAAAEIDSSKVEVDLLRLVYEDARSLLRFNGVDRDRVNTAVDDMAGHVEWVKIFDGSGGEEDPRQQEKG